MASETRKRILQSVKRLVVKVGTTLVTGDRLMIDTGFIRRLAGEVAALRAERGVEAVIVTSGAIGAGLGRLGAAFKKRPTDIAELQALASIGQCDLMEAYAKAFRKQGLDIGQILLTRDCFHDRTRFLNARNTLFSLLKRGVVPVVNENDTVSVDEIRFGDNDTLSAMVASAINAELLVILSDVDGLMAGGRRPLGLVEAVTPDIEALAGGAATHVGSGGMVTKIEAAKIVTSSGEHMIIANGRSRRVLRRIFDGCEVGTLFTAKAARLANKKRWIAFGRSVKGRIAVDGGAAAALLRKKSLLASGITAVEGRFKKGDTVEVIGARKKPVTRGITNYSSGDLQTIRGKKSGEIKKLLGGKFYEEVIHRDNMVEI